MSRAKTGLILDERFLEHREPRGHPERAERLLAVGKALHDGGLVDRARRVEARLVTDEEIHRIHERNFVEHLSAALAAGSGHLDPDTFFSPGSWAAARLAAGGVVDLAMAARAGEIRAGAAFVRPPGHHAEATRAMGFCLLNNVAIAAAALRAAGVDRVAIVDWDVHHGNGTQHSFYRDKSVLYVSLHQFPYYPGTGAADEIGQDEGIGYTVNVPYAPGMGDAEYLFAFKEVVLPVLRQFAPEVVLVSAGFDAHARDPLGGMDLTEEGFRSMTRHLLSLGRPVVAVLEGGYDLIGLSRSSVAMMDSLVRADELAADVPDDVAPTARLVVARVKTNLKPYWSLE